MSNIIVSNVKYRGYNFCKNILMVDNTSKYGFFSLKDFQWFSVDVDVEVTKYASMHGAKVGDAYNGVREFSLTFDAIASDELERFKLIRLVSSIFSPPSIPQNGNGFHDLEFMTPDGVVWTTKAQVKTRPRIFDYDNDKWIGFEVKLIGKENSYIYAKDNSIIKDTNVTLGSKLPFNLPMKAKYYKDSINYLGTSDTPVNVKITYRQDIRTLLIKNKNGDLTKIKDKLNRVFCVRGPSYNDQMITLPYIYIRSIVDDKVNKNLEIGSVTLLPGEEINIDGFESRVEKIDVNGTKTDITNLASINSTRPMLVSQVGVYGNQYLAVECGFTNPVIDVEYAYSDIWD